MRPQQRKFIVEVKSTRRRISTKPASIWGNTDIKALVREAESEAPQLFEPVEQPNNLSISPSVPTVREKNITAGQIADHDASIDRPINKSDSSIALVEDLQPEMPSAKVLQRRPKKRRAVVDSSMIVAAVADVDELTALENENRSLKALLVQRLRQENLLLRDMLERFEARR